MATEAELKAALIKAHNAGDTQAAQLFADKIKAMRAQPAQAQTLGADGLPQLSINENPSGNINTPKPRETSVMEDIVGGGEAALSALTGMIAGAPAMAIGNIEGAIGDLTGRLTPEQAQQVGQDYAQSVTYAPRTEAGQRQVAAIGEALSALPPALGVATPLQAVGAGQAVGRTAQAAGIRAPSMPRPTIQQGADEAVAFAEQNKLPLTTSDISPPTSGVGRGAQVIGEQTPFVGTGGLRGKQQEARVGLLQKLKDETPEISDEALSKSLIDSVNSYKSTIGKRYNDIAQRMGDRKFPIDNTIKAIDSELESLTQGGKIQDKATIAALQEIKDNLLAGDGNSFRVMRDNRTFMRENLKPSADKPSTQADRVIDRVYNAMTDDIQSAVKSTLGDEAAFKLKQADKLFATEINTQKKTKLKKALLNGDVKPEEATKVLFSNSPSDVRELYAALDNKGRSNARAAIINKMLEKANESPDKFLSEANRYKSQYGTFFKGEEKAKLDGMIAYLEATRRASKATVDTPTGLRNVPVIIAGGAGADLFGGGGSVSATIGTIAGLSRLYESKPVRNALIKLSKAKPSDPNYEKLYLAVDAAIKSQAGQQEDKK